MNSNGIKVKNKRGSWSDLQAQLGHVSHEAVSTSFLFCLWIKRDEVNITST